MWQKAAFPARHAEGVKRDAKQPYRRLSDVGGILYMYFIYYILVFGQAVLRSESRSSHLPRHLTGRGENHCVEGDNRDREGAGELSVQPDGSAV